METALRKIGGADEDAVATLARERRRTGVRNVADFVTRNANGILLSDFPEEDYPWFRMSESERFGQLEARMRDLAETVVAPAIEAYVLERFPQECADGEFDPIGEIFLKIDHSATMPEDLLGARTRERNQFLGACGAEESDGRRFVQVAVHLDECMEEIDQARLDEAGVEDFAIQVLLHEFCHALSVKFYLGDEGEFEGARRAVSLHESVLGRDLEWQNLYSRFGYACNFAAPLDEGERLLTYPLINEMNEALTDILAAKIYGRLTGKPGGYAVSYKLPCSALYETVRRLSWENRVPEWYVWKELEAGYFLSDDRFLRSWDSFVFPMAGTYREIIRSAKGS